MRRFHRARDKEAVIDAIIANGKGAFSHIWQVLIFASCLGWKLKRCEPVTDSDASVAVPPSVFLNNCACWPGLAHLIALVDMKEPHALNADEAADEKRIKLLEGYANGGLSYMQERLEPSAYSIGSVSSFLVEHMLSSTGSSDSI